MGPLKTLFKDPEVTEIMVDGPRLVRIEKGGEVIDTKVRFKSARELERLIQQIHGSSEGKENAVRKTRLPDGTRVMSVTGESAIGGPFLLIRKVRQQKATWELMEEWKFLSADVSALLGKIVSGGHSVLVSGSGGSGLLTSVNVLSSRINPICRVIALEENGTLQLQHPHVISLAASKERKFWVETARDLLADVIVSGAIDGPEAFDLVNAAQESTQIIAALLANGSSDALRRLELLCLQSNVAWSAADHRAQIARSIRFVTYQERIPGTGRRVIREITEIDGLENGSYKLEPLMRWNEKSDKFELTPRGRERMK